MNLCFCASSVLMWSFWFWIPTLQTSRSAQGETACGWVWAASPACRPAGWRSACLSGRMTSRRRGSPEMTGSFESTMTRLFATCAQAAKTRTFLNDRHTCACSSTYSDLFAEADLSQDLLYALSAPHLPDGGFHRLVDNWPVPSLKLIPNGA